MNDTIHNDDERFLATFIEPARAAANHPELGAAAERVRERLPEVSEPRARRWVPQFATLALMITGLTVMLPLFLDGGGGTAFAQVQQWFSSYQTIDVHTRILQDDAVLVDVRAQATATGDVRVEQPGATHIIRGSEGTFTTLLPGQSFMRVPIDGTEQTGESLAWLDRLAAFRGEAVVLDEMRIVSGRQAIGHRLVIDGTDLTLWSAALDNQPLLLEGELPGGLQLRTTFEFNVDLPQWIFEVPPGFSQIEDRG